MRRRRLVACMTQVHRARDRAAARSGGWGKMEMLLRQSRVVFAKVRTLPFPCGQPRDAAKEHAREAWPVGDQLRSFRRFGFVEFSVLERD
jgi:hypothetical protein